MGVGWVGRGFWLQVLEKWGEVQGYGCELGGKGFGYRCGWSGEGSWAMGVGGVGRGLGLWVWGGWLGISILIFVFMFFVMLFCNFCMFFLHFFPTYKCHYSDSALSVSQGLFVQQQCPSGHSGGKKTKLESSPTHRKNFVT